MNNLFITIPGFPPIPQPAGLDPGFTTLGSFLSALYNVFLYLAAFLALEKKRLEENISWYEAKRKIISDALFSYLKSPMIPLPVPT